MRKFGLLGYPLGHSFSRKYFSEKFKREKIRDCVYENYPLETLDLLPDLISRNHELCGLIIILDLTPIFLTLFFPFPDNPSIILETFMV